MKREQKSTKIGTKCIWLGVNLFLNALVIGHSEAFCVSDVAHGDLECRLEFLILPGNVL